MKAALSMLAMLQPGLRHYGFFGIEGMMGIIVAIVIFIVIAVILWKILMLVLPKLVQDATWQQVIVWLAVLFLFLLFLHFVGFF